MPYDYTDENNEEQPLIPDVDLTPGVKKKKKRQFGFPGLLGNVLAGASDAFTAGPGTGNTILDIMTAMQGVKTAGTERRKLALAERNQETAAEQKEALAALNRAKTAYESARAGIEDKKEEGRNTRNTENIQGRLEGIDVTNANRSDIADRHEQGKTLDRAMRGEKDTAELSLNARKAGLRFGSPIIRPAGAEGPPPAPVLANIPEEELTPQQREELLSKRAGTALTGARKTTEEKKPAQIEQLTAESKERTRLMPQRLALQQKALNARLKANDDAGHILENIRKAGAWDQIAGLTNTQRGKLLAIMEPEEIDKTGYKPLGDTAVASMSDAEDAIENMKRVIATIDQHEAKFGPLSGQESRIPWADTSKLIQAEIDLAKQKVGRHYEGGVLRKEDEEKYKKILPEITNTPEQARGKAELVLKDLENRYDIFLRNQRKAGRAVNKFGKPGSTNSGFKPKKVSIKGGPARTIDNEQLYKEAQARFGKDMVEVQ